MCVVWGYVGCVCGGVWGVCVGCVYDMNVCTAIGVEVRAYFLFGCLLCLLIVHISDFLCFMV